MTNRKFDHPDGKVVAITGGSSGIGAETAQLFLDRGHIVYILSRTPKLHKKKLTSNKPETLHFISCDVRSEEQVKSSFERIGSENAGIDIAVNCSGILDSAGSLDLAKDDFENVLSTNLVGTWLCMKYQIPEMRKKNAGSIINISSIFGLKGSPGNCAYTASKHGVVGLTKTFAMEFARENIQINCLAPGFTETPMLRSVLSKSVDKERKLLSKIPTKRFVELRDIAKTVYWLACEAPQSIIGHCLVIDDGYTLRT